MSEYNYAAAFVQYCKGVSPEEIAHALAIPLTCLKNHIRLERWSQLAEEHALPTPICHGLQKDLAKVEANRARNFEIARQLQEDLIEVVTKLRDGTLTFEHRTSKGELVKLPPNLRDRRDLASYAKDVAELSYRALGDVVAPAREGGGGGDTEPGQITIVLPGPVANPRQTRSFDVDSEVIVPPRPIGLPEAGSVVVDVPQLWVRECLMRNARLHPSPPPVVRSGSPCREGLERLPGN